MRQITWNYFFKMPDNKCTEDCFPFSLFFFSSFKLDKWNEMKCDFPVGLTSNKLIYKNISGIVFFVAAGDLRYSFILPHTTHTHTYTEYTLMHTYTWRHSWVLCRVLMYMKCCLNKSPHILFTLLFKKILINRYTLWVFVVPCSKDSSYKFCSFFCFLFIVIGVNFVLVSYSYISTLIKF